jgi:hypothetical protein
MTEQPQPPTIDMAQIMRELAQRAETKRGTVAINKPRILEALAAAGVTRVEMRYDGEGDSGGVEQIQCYGADGASLDIPETMVAMHEQGWRDQPDHDRSMRLADALECFLLDVIECAHDGWENNEGAFGNIAIDVAGGLVELSHSDRILSTVDSFEEY